MGPSKHGVLCSCIGYTNMKLVLVVKNHSLISQNTNSSAKIHLNMSGLSTQQSTRSLNPAPAGEESLQGYEAGICFSSGPDPALLLHLGCNIKKKKKNLICNTSHLFPTCLCLFQSLQFLPSWFHDLALISYSGIFSLVSIQISPSDFSDSSFWHQLLALLAPQVLIFPNFV